MGDLLILIMIPPMFRYPYNALPTIRSCQSGYEKDWLYHDRIELVDRISSDAIVSHREFSGQALKNQAGAWCRWQKRSKRGSGAVRLADGRRVDLARLRFYDLLCQDICGVGPSSEHHHYRSAFHGSTATGL